MKAGHGFCLLFGLVFFGALSAAGQVALPRGNAQNTRVFATRSVDAAPHILVWQAEKLFRVKFSESFVSHNGPFTISGDLPTGHNYSLPLVSDGTIFFTVYGGDSYFYVLDTAIGNRIVMLKFDDNEVSTLAAIGATAFFGTGQGSVIAYDAAAKALKWSFEQKDVSFAAAHPVIDAGVVYACGYVIYGEELGNLVALDARTGAEKWKFKTKKPCRDPLIAGTTLYARCADHYHYALDAETGALKWSIDTKANEPTPLVADGVMYALSSDGLLQAFQ